MSENMLPENRLSENESSENKQQRSAVGHSVLHRSLDVQGHAELVLNASGEATNETYQDANGQHLWTLKRFPGVPSTEVSIDNNPEEVE